MAAIDTSYHDLLRNILALGYEYEDPNRKGIIRTEIDEYTIKHDLTKGFPAITTKELHWKSVVGELLWFLRGETNIKYLVDNDINIWNKDAYNYYLRERKNIDRIKDREPATIEEFVKRIKNKSTQLNRGFGDLGPVYGQQWRNIINIDSVEIGNKGEVKTTRRYVDQFKNLIEGLKENPLGTDHIVTAWNPVQLKEMALKPCHFGFQIMVRPLSATEQDLYNTSDSSDEFSVDKYKPKYGFTLKWEQRSVDTFLGLNVSSSKN